MLLYYSYPVDRSLRINVAAFFSVAVPKELKSEVEILSVSITAGLLLSRSILSILVPYST